MYACRVLCSMYCIHASIILSKYAINQNDSKEIIILFIICSCLRGSDYNIYYFLIFFHTDHKKVHIFTTIFFFFSTVPMFIGTYIVKCVMRER